MESELFLDGVSAAPVVPDPAQMEAFSRRSEGRRSSASRSRPL